MACSTFLICLLWPSWVGFPKPYIGSQWKCVWLCMARPGFQYPLVFAWRQEGSSPGSLSIPLPQAWLCIPRRWDWGSLWSLWKDPPACHQTRTWKLGEKHFQTGGLTNATLRQTIVRSAKSLSMKVHWPPKLSLCCKFNSKRASFSQQKASAWCRIDCLSRKVRWLWASAMHDCKSTSMISSVSSFALDCWWSQRLTWLVHGSCVLAESQ